MNFEEFKALVEEKFSKKTKQDIKDDLSKMFGYTFSDSIDQEWAKPSSDDCLDIPKKGTYPNIEIPDLLEIQNSTFNINDEQIIGSAA